MATECGLLGDITNATTRAKSSFSCVFNLNKVFKIGIRIHVNHPCPDTDSRVFINVESNFEHIYPVFTPLSFFNLVRK